MTHNVRLHHPAESLAGMKLYNTVTNRLVRGLVAKQEIV